MFVAPSCFQNKIHRSLARPPQKTEYRIYTPTRILSVHAGAENRTAIHLQPFQELCQPDFFGFHRFFQVFLGFVRN
jgi:hypothetical protein